MHSSITTHGILPREDTAHRKMHAQTDDINRPSVLYSTTPRTERDTSPVRRRDPELDVFVRMATNDTAFSPKQFKGVEAGSDRTEQWLEYFEFRKVHRLSRHSWSVEAARPIPAAVDRPGCRVATFVGELVWQTIMTTNCRRADGATPSPIRIGGRRRRRYGNANSNKPTPRIHLSRQFKKRRQDRANQRSHPDSIRHCTRIKAGHSPACASIPPRRHQS